MHRTPVPQCYFRCAVRFVRSLWRSGLALDGKAWEGAGASAGACCCRAPVPAGVGAGYQEAAAGAGLAAEACVGQLHAGMSPATRACRAARVFKTPCSRRQPALKTHVGREARWADISQGQQTSKICQGMPGTQFHITHIANQPRSTHPRLDLALESRPAPHVSQEQSFHFAGLQHEACTHAAGKQVIPSGGQ